MKYAILIAIAITTLLYNPFICESYYDLKPLGFSHSLSDIINEGCKKARSHIHCVRTSAFLAWNESTAGQNAYKQNIWWMHGGESESEQEAFNKWFRTYNKWWYKTSGAWDFYSPYPGKLPRTRYCLSEYQPDGRLLNWCPNGYKNANSYLTKFNALYETHWPKWGDWIQWWKSITIKNTASSVADRIHNDRGNIHVGIPSRKKWQPIHFDWQSKGNSPWVERKQDDNRNTPKKKWSAKSPDLQKLGRNSTGAKPESRGANDPIRAILYEPMFDRDYSRFDWKRNSIR